jgi:capsular exopolysaccharide synthesis family protein
LLLGVVAGLLLGGVAAFIREMVDDAVHTSDELEKQLDLPLLGMAPALPQSKISEPSVRLPFGEPQFFAPWTIQITNWPSSWESLDLVYKNIELLSSVSSFHSLLVTSAQAGEGKSTLALGLALSAARLHQRVLLIDVDLRRPNLHKQLNLSNEQGLSTLLTNNVSVPTQRHTESSGSYIDILTAGPTPIDPANLLSSQRMRELMTAFEQNYDLVLLDAPPVLGLVDAILAASFCSGVVLVARIGQVTRTELTQATAMLSKLNVIGMIANDTVGAANAYYVPYKKQNDGIVLQQSFGK